MLFMKSKGCTRNRKIKKASYYRHTFMNGHPTFEKAPESIVSHQEKHHLFILLPFT